MCGLGVCIDIYVCIVASCLSITLVFLGTVEKSDEEKWSVPVGINGHDVVFRVDTGADVSVMSKTTFDSKFSTNKLQPAPKTIRGADHNVINTYGCFLANVTFKEKQCSEQIYVFERATNLLSCKASHALGIVSFVGVAAEEEYPQLFCGLGTIDEVYDIKLVDDARPHSVRMP